MDHQITAFVNAKTPVTHSYAKRALSAMAVHGIVAEAAQVAVRGLRRATAIDIVGKRGIKTPYLVELKTTGLSATNFLHNYEKAEGTYNSLHWGVVPNSVRNQYREQLFNGMNMYGRTFRFKEGTPINGCLLIVCFDEVLMFEQTLIYSKGTGVNAPAITAKGMKKKKKCTTTRPIVEGSSQQPSGAVAAMPTKKQKQSRKRTSRPKLLPKPRLISPV